jgi:hypothetical protein
MDRSVWGESVGKRPVKPELRTGDLPPASDRGIHGETYGSAGAIVARFRRPRAGDRGLIAAPWTPLASLCFPHRVKTSGLYHSRT